MKINQELHVKLDQVTKESKNTSAANARFLTMVQKQSDKLQFEGLNKLMKDIEGVGSRLVRSRNFKDLARYKMLVKKFVKEAVDYGMDLNQSQSWNQYGQSRHLQTVQTIDDKLVQLTEDILNQEKDALTILGQIGEIKGLLINLYT